MLKINKVALNGLNPVLLADWNFRFYLIIAVHFFTIVLIIVLHISQHIRTSKKLKAIKKLQLKVEKHSHEIARIRNDLLPYFESLSNQRDTYKSKLKTKYTKLTTTS